MYNVYLIACVSCNKFIISFRTYCRYIIPHIMWSSPNKDILRVISESCTEPLTTILQDCLPLCMVFIITQLATDSESSNRPLATSCYKYLESVLSSDVLTETMKHSLNEFVVELLIRLYVQYDGDSFLSKYMRYIQLSGVLYFFIMDSCTYLYVSSTAYMYMYMFLAHFHS